MGFFDFIRKKNTDDAPKHSPAEAYLLHLYRIFQCEPVIYRNESEQKGLPGVSVLVYKDVPAKGHITGITYGLSLVQHPKWKLGRPELCISVKSEHEDWAEAAAFMANRLRGQCPFSYGETIRFGERIHPESEMDAFFVFAPGIFVEKSDYLQVDIGADYKISIAGLYPMYSDEVDAYQRMGLENFWHHPNFDLYNIKRKRISDTK